MFDVRPFGAVGDGKNLDTLAIQAALDACQLAGGGEVYLPAGRFLSSTLSLPGMHGLWLEKSKDARVERFNCYPLQPGFEAIKTLP